MSKTKERWIEPVVRVLGSNCAYCGVDIFSQPGMYHTDHVFPKGKGGPDRIENIVPSCSWCNGRKGKSNISRMRRIVALKDSRWLDIISLSDYERAIALCGAKDYGESKFHLEDAIVSALNFSRSFLKENLEMIMNPSDRQYKYMLMNGDIHSGYIEIAESRYNECVSWCEYMMKGVLK